MNATSLRQQLAAFTVASGGHKEQADRYRTLLEQILAMNEAENELLKIFIEASE
jgi:hypothetical protein